MGAAMVSAETTFRFPEAIKVGARVIIQLGCAQCHRSRELGEGADGISQWSFVLSFAYGGKVVALCYVP